MAAAKTAAQKAEEAKSKDEAAVTAKDEKAVANATSDAGETPPGSGIEKASGLLGSDEVQAATDEAEAKGFLGVATDPKPNSAYSMEGGAPKSD